MRLIPVIDLKGGAVVAAVGGARRHYRELQSPLSASATLSGVSAGLQTLYPFADHYVADLDAIAGHGDHTGEVFQYAAAHPNLRVWLDAGIRSLAAVEVASVPANIHLVVGSETLTDLAALKELKAAFAERLLLSLDFRGDNFLGPVDLLQHPETWPGRIIVMTLAQVGARQGLDLPKVIEILSRADGRDVFAAGGVRHLSDMKTLHDLGAKGALVATALHNGQIKTGDLQEIAGL
ncbi:MAG: nickel transporter [Alphaproteobacteria bacterium]|nr:nickel transporter [Alphaproteobacteria bacterium]